MYNICVSASEESHDSRISKEVAAITRLDAAMLTIAKFFISCQAKLFS